METHEIILTIAEMHAGAQTGINRQIAALKRELKDQHGFNGDGWGIHIEGACGEIAFCKLMNRFWSPSVNTFKTEADVGEQYEVRTRSQHEYELLIREDDNDDRIFVLVTGHAPKFIIHGWKTGREAKRDEWQQTHGGRPPAWFVPHINLEPISLIPKRGVISR